MHATIDVRFEISIDESKTIRLATLTEFITEQNIESVLLESMAESLDAVMTETRFESLQAEQWVEDFTRQI